MSTLHRVSIVVFAAAVLLSGFTPARSSAAPGAKAGRVEVAWKHSERALKTVGSKYKINLPYITPGAEWLVGVKPVRAGEKEKMYVGVFTWTDDSNRGPRGNALKRLTRMEDYPRSLSNFADGYATLNGAVNPDETLVIYLEVAPTTRIAFNDNGRESSFSASEGSYLVHDGKFEKSLIEHTGSLIARAHTRKMKKEMAARSLSFGGRRFGLGNAVFMPASAFVAPEPAQIQDCILEDRAESCVGGECTCWSVTNTCGSLSCSSSGGSCRESGGVSISWSIPTVCNFNMVAQ